MSYGAYARQASRYREADVLSASPGQLIVLVYEHLLVNLRRARLLTGPQDGEARSEALHRARAALTELLVALDREKGGDIAARLGALYTFFLSELTVMGVRPDVARLDRIIGMVGELHDAFGRVADAAPAAAAAG